MKTQKLSAIDFRKELQKVMPGYKWTVHRKRVQYLSDYRKVEFVSATGIQTAGFNRMSTLRVVKRRTEDEVMYDVKSSGFGTNYIWLGETTGLTLKQALRDLQNFYENQSSIYKRHANDLEYGREKNEKCSPYV